MVAKHHPDNEIVETPWHPYVEPTREYYGECGVCDGTGRVPSFERVGCEDPCWNCDGDGKSEKDDDAIPSRF